MDKKQAYIEAMKIFQESGKKADEIMKKAKEEGAWEMGLDSNNSLFEELHKETKEKLKLLSPMIDED